MIYLMHRYWGLPVVLQIDDPRRTIPHCRRGHDWSYSMRVDADGSLIRWACFHCAAVVECRPSRREFHPIYP